jgi:hypothetical protein
MIWLKWASLREVALRFRSRLHAPHLIGPASFHLSVHHPYTLLVGIRPVDQKSVYVRRGPTKIDPRLICRLPNGLGFERLDRTSGQVRLHSA